MTSFEYVGLLEYILGVFFGSSHLYKNLKNLFTICKLHNKLSVCIFFIQASTKSNLNRTQEAENNVNCNVDRYQSVIT